MSKQLGLSQLKNLATVPAKELQKFLNSFDEVLCDCDGVLYSLAVVPIPGAVEAVNWLKSTGKNVRFVSNNCTKKLHLFNQKLTKIGIKSIADEDIVYPTLAIISYLKSIHFNKTVYVLGTDAMKLELKEAGFSVVTNEFYKFEESLDTLSTHLKDDKSIGAVIIDWDINLNYIALQKALVYLCRSDVLYITGASDKILPFSSECEFNLIGPGYFQNAVKDVSGRTEYGFGKPSANLNTFIIEKYNIVNTRRVLFIGDSIPQDMKFATLGNYIKLLVLSGVTKKEDLENWIYSEAYVPNYYVETLGALFDTIKHKLE